MRPLAAVVCLVLAGCADELTVATDSLPVGTVGEVYRVQIGARGGTSPHRWSLAGGELPAGLTLNPSGAISGVPSVATDAVLQLQVEDARGRTSMASLQLDIRYDADTLECGGEIGGSFDVAAFMDYQLDTTVTEGLAWIQLPPPSDKLTRVELDTVLSGFGVGIVYVGAPGTQPGDTDLSSYLTAEYLGFRDSPRLDLSTLPSLDTFRALGEPITLLIATQEPATWSMQAICTESPVMRSLRHAPVEVGQPFATGFSVHPSDPAVRVWTDDPLPDWVDWDERRGALSGIARDVGVVEFEVSAEDVDGNVRVERSAIAVYEPVPVSCGETLSFQNTEGMYDGELNHIFDTRGYLIARVQAAPEVSEVRATLRGGERMRIGFASEDTPYLQALRGVGGIVAASPASWPRLQAFLSGDDHVYLAASEDYGAPPLELEVACDAAPRPARGSLPVLDDSGPMSLPLESYGGVGEVTWSASGLPDDVSLSPSGVLTSDGAQAGTYPVEITLEDEEGGLSRTPMDLSVGFDAACGERERLRCGEVARGEFTGDIFDATGEYQTELCVVPDGRRVLLAATTGPSSLVWAQVLTPSRSGAVMTEYIDPEQSEVLVIDAELELFRDRVAPVNLQSLSAGSWELSVQCD